MFRNLSAQSLKCALFAVVALGVLLSGPAWAKVIYVKADAAGSNNGESWGNAYTDLRAALTASVANDEVWVAQGTYKPVSSAIRGASFDMKRNVGLYGGFAGTESERGQRSWRTNPTILSGDIGTTGVGTDNVYRVVNGHTAALDGFTIQDFCTNGMFNSNCSPTVTNCIFKDGNGTSAYCVYNYNGSVPTLTNCVFSGGNNPFGSGGGMYNRSGCNVTVVNCAFADNTAKYGGGIYNDTTTVTLLSCTFSGNSADSGGGSGMYNYRGTLRMTNCIFWDNVESGRVEVFNGPLVTSAVFQHCDVRGSGGGGVSWNTAFGTDGGGNIEGDPRFFDAATAPGRDDLWRTADDGLRLWPGSPCRGKADPAFAPILDIIDFPRRPAPAIGAYECRIPTSADPVWQLLR
jgi:hypothetical protein